MARDARGVMIVRSERREGPEQGAPIGFGRMGLALSLASGVPESQLRLKRLEYARVTHLSIGPAIAFALDD